MARPKLSVNKESVKEARKEVSKSRKEVSKLRCGKLFLQLRAIISFEDYTSEQIAKIFGISPRTLFCWLRRFSEHGIS